MASEHSTAQTTGFLGSTVSQARPGERPHTIQWVALTILAHPDVRRTGERALLPQLSSGEAALLSRLSPAFRQPTGGRERPLADKHLSRQAVRLVPTPGKTGEIAIRRDTVRSRLEVDGLEIADEHRISRQNLTGGVTLVLAERVALLLHLVELRPGSDAPAFGLIGDSSALALLRQEIRKVGPHSVPVLIRGETGTGKELVARAIHRASPRAVRPLVSINMGAVPATLAAAELFGAVPGAYTGAEKRIGFFQRAAGGTLFLDEIGEAPQDVQVMLLRALETSEIQPVGSTVPIKLDVRVLAATDAALESAIAEGRFRAPLLHRLSGYELELPSLRQRRDDIGRLLFHFLEEELRSIGQAHRFAATEEEQHPWLPATLVARMARDHWPGNVRQLRNAARQLVIGGLEASDGELEELMKRILRDPVEDVRRAPVPSGSADAPPRTSRRPPKSYRPPHEVSDEELVSALRANGWNLKPTAQHLGISRASLYVLIDRCPKVRRASELDPAEIEKSYERHHGDLDRMADELEVSRYGLQHRLRELRISPSS